jgi:Domain of unknown function (DUF4281)
MTLDLMFKLASTIAMVGWLTLLASPWWPRLSDLIAGYFLPLLLSAGYMGLILANWTGSEGGFDTLDNVIKLFQRRELVLAGWVHYLAFDLFVGAWEARTGRAEGLAFWLVVPCLFLTLMFGPIGLLVFAALRLARSARVSAV